MADKIVNFITNLSLEESSGGGSGVNFATYQQLSKHFRVNYIGPVSSPINKVAHFRSKIFRSLGLRGDYFFFSEERLKSISKIIQGKVGDYKADYYFFHGFTPWIKFKPVMPYFAYSDACFSTYVKIYNNINSFSIKDLRRIFDQEAEWLSDASIVFFRSKWALDQTIKDYKISGQNFKVAGLGGFVDIPAEDDYKGGVNILFVSREFIPKGGIECFNAFKIIKSKIPHATLTIIGEQPPKFVLQYPSVKYMGFLRKSVPEEYAIFKRLLSTAFLLVHPTTKDTNALVITEAGYYGCPAIATNSFAIPEFIIDGETGFLIDNPNNVDQIAEKALSLIANRILYSDMRRQVRSYTTSKFTWNNVGSILWEQIDKF